MQNSEATEALPLVVDLDGTLIASDLLHESYFGSLGKGVRHHLGYMRAFLRNGRAGLKAFLADAIPIDYTRLPYNKSVIALIEKKRSEGSRIYLATASDSRHAEAIAAHTGLFDGVFASDGTTNLKSHSKAQMLVEQFGEGRFDYIGNSSADLAIWAKSRKAYAISTSGATARKLSALRVPVEHLTCERATVKTWAKALRVHQYAKNALLFVPILTSHTYSASAFLTACLAFLLFSFCASAVYIFNDIIDLESDRQHPTKCNRPFACGQIPIAQGLLASALLALIAFAGAFALSPLFGVTLLAYFALTFGYSVYFKRKMIIDVVILAMLYTIRVIAGAVAIDVSLSEWLLAFSMFIFTCLALVKRYIELAVRIDNGLPDPTNRNYALQDISIIGALAAASGYNAITIFALYISSPAVKTLYRNPHYLWLICPILIYWVGRLLVLAQRRMITDDPIFFALRDHVSYLAIGAMAAIMLLAS